MNKKKFLIGLSAVVVGSAFWACGSGEIAGLTADDNYIKMMYVDTPDDDVGSGAVADLISKSKVACQQDPACKMQLDMVENDPGNNESLVRSSSAAAPTSSFTPMTPMSSQKINVVTSSATDTPTPTPASSAIAIEVPGNELGSCAPSPAVIDRGGSVTWSFTAKTTVFPVADIQKANFVWSIPGGTPETGAGTGVAGLKVAGVTYAESGKKNATLSITKGDGTISELPCGTLQVNGAKITGCTCTAASSSVDVASGETAVWTVAGCTTVGANITTYTWSGTGVTGAETSAVAEFAEKGQSAKPSVTVANDDNSEVLVECDEVKAIDSRIPDYIIEAQGATGDIALPAGTTDVAVAVDLPDGQCTFVCKSEWSQELNGAISGSIDGVKISGNYNVTASLPGKCKTGQSVVFKLDHPAKCGIQ